VNIYNKIESVPFLQQAVITIGTFDGVHKAHHCILEKVVLMAKQIKGTSVVISFSSHPRKIIHPDLPLNILTTQKEKNILFQKIGIDVIIYIDFTESVAEMSYIDFIKLLTQKMEIKAIIAGYDHNFGKNKEGNSSSLKKMISLFGFEIIEIPKQTIDEIEISSSSVRDAINKKNINLANYLLGYNYQIETDIIFQTEDYITVVPEDKDKTLPPKGKYGVKIVDKITWVEVRDDNMYIYCRNTDISPVNEENRKITIEFINQ
jgi:riboflavin kinase/FMN adenylyltransferase